MVSVPGLTALPMPVAQTPAHLTPTDVGFTLPLYGLTALTSVASKGVAAPLARFWSAVDVLASLPLPLPGGAPPSGALP